MKKSKKGFTLIELTIAMAISAILVGVISTKVKSKLNKAKVAEVQSELISSRLLIKTEYLSDFEFPDLTKQDKSILEKYQIESTLAFTSSDKKSHPKTNKIVTTRNNTGGWYYDINNGEFYANLPNGAYTHDKKHEIWDGESPTPNNNITPSSSNTSPHVSRPKHYSYHPVNSPKKTLTTTPKVTPIITKQKTSDIPKIVYNKPNKINNNKPLIVPKATPYAKPITPKTPTSTPKKDSLGYVGGYHPPSSIFKNLGHLNPSLDFNEDVKLRELEKNPILDTAKRVRSLASGGITKDNDGIKLHPEIIKTSDGKTILHIRPEIVQKIEHSDGFSSGFLAFLDNHNLNHVIPDIPNQALISDKQLISLDDIYLDLTDLPQKPKTFTMMFEYFNSDKNDQQAYAYKTVTLDYGTE